MNTAIVTLERLKDQRDWYDQRAGSYKNRYQALKLFTLICSAGIPLTAAFGAPTWVAALMGSLIVVSEGVLALKDYHKLWVTYRATSESLKREEHLYLAGAGPYRRSTNAAALLAERVEEHLAGEHDRWREDRMKEAEPKLDKDAGKEKSAAG